MSEDDAIALRGLVDIREPAMSDVAVWGELLLAFGVGLLAALGISALLSLVMRRRERAVDPLPATRDLPPGERLVALARLARARGVALPEGAREALYRPGVAVDLDALEASVAGR